MERSTRKLAYKARNPEETKERILSSATAEFAEFGFLGARVERIAQRSDVTMRMLYHYFKSKEYLYGVVLRRVFEQVESAEMECPLGAGGPQEKMGAIIAFAFDLFLRNPQFIKLTMGQNFLEAEHLRRLKSLAPHHEGVAASVRAVLEEGQTAGVFRRDVDAVHLWMTIHGLCWGLAAGQHALGAPSVDLADPDFRAARLRHIQDVVLAFLSA